MCPSNSPSLCLSFFCLSASLKTQQFCETSSLFDLDNIKSEAILRDFLKFGRWQHQKQSTSARLPSKMESSVQRWRLVSMRFPIFPVHLPKVLRLPRESEARTYEVLHLSHKIILANLKIWCSKTQPFSAPGPPNMSDEHASCTAPKCIFADLLQLCHACQRVWNCYIQNRHALLPFGKVPNPLRLPRKTTS